MSVDPVGAGLADLAALVDAELAALASDAQALRAVLVENTIVQARVLPSNGLTDLLEIAGYRVAAALPPTVRPGDTLSVKVSGFVGDQILVQIVGDEPAQEPPPNVPLAPAPGVFVAASIQPANPAAAGAPPQPSAPAASTPTAPPPPGAAPMPASPSAAPNAGAQSVAAASLGAARTVPQGTYAAFTRAFDDGPRAAAPPMPRAAAPTVPTTIEARLAAARASAAPATSAPQPSRAAVPPPQARYVAPPPIASKAPPAQISTARPAALTGAAPAAGAVSTPRATGLSAYTEPVALLRALRLPVTPSTVASATLALQRPEQLPNALATLARALPQGNADPQVATLRTLLAFVGRIEPDSPTLPAQIAAYVDQVVDGTEPKLATLLAAARAAAPAPAANNVPTLPAAVVAERSAAIDADLKQTLLAVASDPATPAAVAPALAGALTALSAVQLQAAQLLTAQPEGIAFTIPLAMPGGNTNARIAIDREAPRGRGVPVDGDNFRIAFVLDTAHYGTVAIDLVTVGREVTVDLRAENGTAMRAFRDALGGLTARLETLRYRVASAQAALGTTTTLAVAAPPSSPRDPDANVDRSV
ncbi:MAG TPA: hypothetical protein VMA36_03940 [Candidatus Limnocylindria bacterium]|nr:hypothetical protein [Candidatus Limnocylindria bacterium]